MILLRPRAGGTGGSSGGGGGKTGPANIGLLTNSVTHNAATACRDALVAEGHTVTLIADSGVGSHDYSPYDVVITSRTANASRSAIASKLNELNAAGMPLVVYAMESGLSGSESVETHTTLMGVTGNVAVTNSARNISITNNQHPITQGLSLGSQEIYSVANWETVVASGTSHVGSALASGYAGRTVLIAAEAGGPKLTSGTFGARVVFCPTYLVSGAFTGLHRTLLNRSVEWAI